MSFTLSLETDTGTACPFWFSHTDSKSLVHYLVEKHVWQIDGPDLIGLCAQQLQLDIAPLQKVAGQAWDLEEYLAEAGDDPEAQQQAEEAWKREQAANAAAWQAPATLRVCLERFIKAIQMRPDVFVQMGVTDHYFINGGFRDDLLDLLQMTAWAQEQGIERVRLSCA